MYYQITLVLEDTIFFFNYLIIFILEVKKPKRTEVD